MTWEQFWPALPGLIALVATIAKIIADWRKGKAEAADLLVDSATDIVGLLRQDVDDLRKENRSLKNRVRRLETQVRALGAVPVNGEIK